MESFMFISGLFLVISYVFVTTAVIGESLNKNQTRVDQEMKEFEEFLTK